MCSSEEPVSDDKSIQQEKTVITAVEVKFLLTFVVFILCGVFFYCAGKVIGVAAIGRFVSYHLGYSLTQALLMFLVYYAVYGRRQKELKHSNFVAFALLCLGFCLYHSIAFYVDHR